MAQNEQIGQIKCPCCDREAPIKNTFKRKPYIICEQCGFQGFARGPEAVAGLLRKMTPTEKPKPAPAPAPGPVVAVTRHTTDGGKTEETITAPQGEKTIFDMAYSILGGVK